MEIQQSAICCLKEECHILVGKFFMSLAMLTISTTAQLADFCTDCAKHDYVTIDTEFLRERTYYSKLCLIQMAYPGESEDSAVLIDVLEKSLDLGPLYDLFENESVTKVFHAARQDLEISKI